MPEHKGMTFDDPPVKEVALGRTFLYRPDFLLPYFGVFWTRIRDRFPSAEQSTPIVDPNEQLNDAAFTPRVLLVDANSSTLVQIQQNLFFFNWRQSDAAPDYIRFPAIQTTFVEMWKEFDTFVAETTGRPLQPLKGELTYTNFVEGVPGQSATDLAATALQDSRWAGGTRFLGAPRGFSHSYAFELPDGHSSLRVSIVAAHRKLPESSEKIEALKVELTVRGNCSGEDSFEIWSEQAHQFLVNAFKDLTTPEMHRRWKLRGA